MQAANTTETATVSKLTYGILDHLLREKANTSTEPASVFPVDAPVMSLQVKKLEGR